MQEKFHKMLDYLRGEFLERDYVLKLMVTALIGRFHVFLLGGGGVGKTGMVEAITSCISGGKVFTFQMSETNTLEEVIGPIRFSKMKDDVHERLLTDYLADAHLAMLDEIGRSNGPVRNALYRILNERKYKNGSKEVRVPLQTLYTGSNSLLLDPADEAFMDRFLYRYAIDDRIKNPDNFMKLLDHESTPLDAYPKFITLDELAQAQAEAKALPLTDELKEAFRQIEEALLEQGIKASPRRWKQLAQSLRAFAWMDGASEVSVDYADWIADGLWRKPEERDKITSVVGNISNPELARAIKVFDNMKKACDDVPGTDSTNFWELSSKALFIADKGIEILTGMRQTTRVNTLLKDAAALKKGVMQKSKSASSLSMI